MQTPAIAKARNAASRSAAKGVAFAQHPKETRHIFVSREMERIARHGLTIK